MTTGRASIGHCAMTAERAVPAALALALLLGAGSAWAAEPDAPPAPPLPAQAAHQVAAGDDLWSRLLPDEPSPVRRQDAAIFTELLPVSASEPAVRLPEDQREAE